MSEPTKEIITMEDEDGVAFDLQVLDRLEVKGVRYIVVQEVQDGEAVQDDEGESVMIYRLIDHDGDDEEFEPIEDEDELEDVFDMFRIAWYDYDFCDAE